MTENYSESLAPLGWDSYFETQYQALKIPESVPCRVGFEFKNSYRVYSPNGELPAVISGKMHYDPIDGYPAVGDWVVVKISTDGQQGLIQSIIPRKSKFSRKAAGPKTAEQILAANIDTAFIVSALDSSNFNLRRMERYLTLAWNSGANPVIILNKVDLCPNPDKFVRDSEEIAFGVPVHAVSAINNIGMEHLKTYLGTGQTAVFLGSSGVGKSAMVNALLGNQRQATGEIREYDNKGRHTTTSRDLLLLPGGGMVIDTPGMKQIQMWGDEDDLEDSFDDIVLLSQGCHFNDCRHDTEPGCAVKAALDSGELDIGRYTSFRKLQKELRYIASTEEYGIRLEMENRMKKIAKMGKQIQKYGKRKP